MSLRSPVPWLVAVLIVLLVGGGFSLLADSRADAAAAQRLAARTEWDVLESETRSQMTRATHGRAPFDDDAVGRDDVRLQEHQQALVEAAPHAEAEIDTFVTLLRTLETPEDAASEGDIALTIITTRHAVLIPLQERQQAWEHAASWSLPVTLALAALGTAVGLQRCARCATQERCRPA